MYAVTKCKICFDLKRVLQIDIFKIVETVLAVIICINHFMRHIIGLIVEGK